MQRERLPPQPPHGKDDARDALLRETGRRAERLFRAILIGLYGESAVSTSRYPEIAAAEIVAVAAGRKPLYHELLSPEAAESIADILRFIVPEEVTVSAQAGHLVAWREEEIRTVLDADHESFYPARTSIEAVVWWAVSTGNCGELLGYGVRRLGEPDTVRVLIAEGEDVLAGLQAPGKHARKFAETRAFDYAFYLQRDLTILLSNDAELP
jgi:hypothetical protein